MDKVWLREMWCNIWFSVWYIFFVKKWNKEENREKEWNKFLLWFYGYDVLN